MSLKRLSVAALIAAVIGGLGLGAAEAGEASGRAAERGAAASKDGQRADPVMAVARAIAVEARDHWKAGDGWPRSDASYASDHPEALTSEQALAALQRKLFDHPALDGYVKRQLLGYVSDSDLASADRGTIFKSLRVLPQVIDQPEPQLRRGARSGGGSVTGTGGAHIFIGRQVPFIAGFTPVVGDGEVVLVPDIEILSTGTLLSTEGVVTVGRNAMLNIEATTNELVRLRRFTARANEPIIGLREALAERIADPPLRLALLLDDASVRLHAGDPSYKRAIGRFVEATATHRRSREVPRKTRRALIRHLEDLADYEKKRIREIEVMNDTQFKVHHATIAWPAEMMQRAVLNLRGRTPPSFDDE